MLVRGVHNMRKDRGQCDGGCSSDCFNIGKRIDEGLNAAWEWRGQNSVILNKDEDTFLDSLIIERWLGYPPYSSCSRWGNGGGVFDGTFTTNKKEIYLDTV